MQDGEEEATEVEKDEMKDEAENEEEMSMQMEEKKKKTGENEKVAEAKTGKYPPGLSMIGLHCLVILLDL